ncbi:MAG TPA: 4-(cytidine 5'-diphospho)-2-C-methyl-D-erythritol kinase, partial [Bacteroidota bacterium]|nr:4-(cytidine 5'-diphospho)-2-C-methyl-D-erythritol kinase [Bacteroidota bacterium]
PIGAGLGGGSSDAAATLRMLPSIWQTTIDPSTLARVALGIGSDVPFFLHHRSAYAEGRGEKLSFVNLTLPYWIVVVTPRIHVSTAWAYSQLTSSRRNGLHAEKFYDDTTCTVAGIAALMKNDFEEVVLAKYPDIGHLKQGLLDCGASYALLSGSGSSVFGLFEDEHRALKARERFVAAHTVSLTPPNFIPEL